MDIATNPAQWTRTGLHPINDEKTMNDHHYFKGATELAYKNKLCNVLYDSWFSSTDTNVWPFCLLCISTANIFKGVHCTDYFVNCWFYWLGDSYSYHLVVLTEPASVSNNSPREQRNSLLLPVSCHNTHSKNDQGGRVESKMIADTDITNLSFGQYIWIYRNSIQRGCFTLMRRFFFLNDLLRG